MHFTDDVCTITRVDKCMQLLECIQTLHIAESELDNLLLYIR